MYFDYLSYIYICLSYFIHLLNKYLLSDYIFPGCVLDRCSPCLQEFGDRQKNGQLQSVQLNNICKETIQKHIHVRKLPKTRKELLKILEGLGLDFLHRAGNCDCCQTQDNLNIPRLLSKALFSVPPSNLYARLKRIYFQVT